MGVDRFEALFVNQLSVKAIRGKDSTSPLTVGIGAATSHSLNSSNDLFVIGKFEVDGLTYFDAAVLASANFTCTAGIICGASTSSYFQSGGGGEGWKIGVGSAVDRGTFFSLGVTGYGNNVLMIGADTQKSTDYSRSTMLTNPTLFIQSASATAAHAISISHDQTDGNIDSLTGTLNLGATGNVNFAGATKTGTGDTATDGYVTMEVAGASVKFATIA